VVVKGKATAYAGSPVTDAAVTWRVVRNARFPRPWWLGTDRFPMSRAMEIASGTGITGPGGEFEVRFPAIPDEAIAPSLSPVFTYTVQVTVADASGETHDARSTVSAGYESLILTTNLGEAVNRDEAPDIEVTATNLDKKPEKVSGEVTVSRITPPARIIFPTRPPPPDRKNIPRPVPRRDLRQRRRPDDLAGGGNRTLREVRNSRKGSYSRPPEAGTGSLRAEHHYQRYLGESHTL